MPPYHDDINCRLVMRDKTAITFLPKTCLTLNKFVLDALWYSDLIFYMQIDGVGTCLFCS